MIDYKSGDMLFVVGLLCLIVFGTPVFALSENGRSDADAAVFDLEQVISLTEPILEDEPNRQVVHLGLQDCIGRALEHNLDIRIESLTPEIRMEEVTAAESVFDAALFSSTQFNITDRDEIDTGYDTEYKEINGVTKTKRLPIDPFVSTHDDLYEFGVRKLLPLGTSVQLSQQLRRYKDLTDENDVLYRNPFYEYGLQFQLQQPLLRDFGVDVNKSSIRVARMKHNISKQQFEMKMIDTIVEVERNYWRLFLARQQVNFNKQLLARAEKTLEKVQSRLQYDVSSISLARTKGVVAAAKADLTSARKSLLQQQEILLESINDPQLSLNGNWEIIHKDRPTVEFYPVDKAKVQETAMKMRPEIVAQQLGIDISALAMKVADNQRLPRLDLFYQQEMTGAGASSHSAWREQGQNDMVSYVVGLSFEFPVGNRAAEANYQKMRIRKHQERLGLDSVIEQIKADVNNAVHGVNLAYSEIAARNEAAEFDKNEVLSFLAIQDTERRDTMTPEFLNIKLNADVRLARSQIVAVQAMVQYDLAIMNLHRANGTLLKYNNIELDEE